MIDITQIFFTGIDVRIGFKKNHFRMSHKCSCLFCTNYTLLGKIVKIGCPAMPEGIHCNILSQVTGKTDTPKEQTHTHKFVAKKRVEDFGYYDKVIERHYICFYCHMILDDMTPEERRQHDVNVCHSAQGHDYVTVGVRWVRYSVTDVASS